MPRVRKTVSESESPFRTERLRTAFVLACIPAAINKTRRIRRFLLTLGWEEEDLRAFVALQVVASLDKVRPEFPLQRAIAYVSLCVFSKVNHLKTTACYAKRSTGEPILYLDSPANRDVPDGLTMHDVIDSGEGNPEQEVIARETLVERLKSDPDPGQYFRAARPRTRSLSMKIENNRLREHRKRLGLTLSDVARHLGTSPSSICLHEKGKRGVDDDTIRRYAELYRVDLHEVYSQ